MWVLLYCVVVAVGSVTGVMCCNVTIGSDTYKMQILLSDYHDFFGLAVDYTNNILYCSYYTDVWFSAKFDLRTRVFNKIEELTGRCTFAVDQVRQKVHAGCVNDKNGRGAGLYSFDSNVGRFVLAGEERQGVVFVHYNNDAVFYSHQDSFLLHKFSKGHSSRVQEATSQVLSLVVDKHKAWIFRNDTGLYRQRAGAVVATRYGGIYSARTLSVDASGAAYVSDLGYPLDTIYRLHEWTPSMSKLLDVTNCNSLTFDRDNNIIYSDYANKNVVRLVKC